MLYQDLIAYEMVERQPFSVRECTAGTGAACGAVFLNRNFEKLLHERLDPHDPKVLTPKRLMEAVRNFEGNLKFSFDPFSEECEDEFEVPLPGAPDIPRVGLEEGYIKLSKHRAFISEPNFLEKIFCKRSSCRLSIEFPD